MPAGENRREVKFYRDCILRFIDREEGAKYLTVEDDFLSGMSRFDLQSRLKTTKEVTKSDYLAMTSEQLLDWSDADIELLTEQFTELKPRLELFELPFSKEVLLIKYSGRGEGDACYTRRNGIVFAKNTLHAESLRLQHVVPHELFHVLSRENEPLRRKLYEIIGFKPCNPIDLPERIADLKISNPDAPTIDTYITLQDTDEQGIETTRHAVPILYSDRAFDPKTQRNFFESMKFSLMEVEQSEGRWKPSLTTREGKRDQPMLIDPESSGSFMGQIGRNTGYIIHPDEILADNFALLVIGKQNLPSPKIIQAMQEVLQAKETDNQPE